MKINQSGQAWNISRNAFEDLDVMIIACGCRLSDVAVPSGGGASAPHRQPPGNLHGLGRGRE